MGLELSISATEEINSFIIHDCTGKYTPDNEGGYGLPNVRIEDATDAFFEIRTPSLKESDEAIKIVVYPDLPSLDVSAYEILPSMLNFTNDEIESGEYKIKYTVLTTDKLGVNRTNVAYLTKVFTKTIECCIDKMTANKLTKGVFKDEKQKLVIELSNLLEDVKKQIDCELTKKANETIEYLKSQCKCCDC